MWWNSMSLFQQVMFVIACAATAVLLIQIILMLISGASDADFSGGGISDADVSDATDIGEVSDIGDGGVGEGLSSVFDGSPSASDVGGHIDGDNVHTGGSSLPFGLRLLSFRSIVAFLAVGAWIGYTLCYAIDWYIALILALAGGFAAACGMAAAILGMEKLQSNGNINPQNAIGKTGTVYLTVPPARSGFGKVNILIQERYAEYEAVTDSNEPLPTSSEIKVIGHTGANVLLVERYKKPSITVEKD